MFIQKSAKFLCLGLILLTSASSFADYPKIYPFVPFETEEIHKSIREISEDENAIINFQDIISRKLSEAKTTEQPWGSTYWPLNKGLIADPYENSYIGYTIEIGTISWTRNYNKFQGRLNGILANIDNYNSSSLHFLAPSEKYDLLLGDKTFDLTRRLWDFTQKWGNKKENAFLTNLDIAGETMLDVAQNMVDLGWFKNVEDAFLNAYQLQGTLSVEYALELVKSGKYETIKDAMPEANHMALAEADNFVLEKKNNLIAMWEGICHGWATSAGIIARPRKTIKFELPDGREMKFFPSDIKALASLSWANSLIQDNKLIDEATGENIGGGVISQGLRCNLDSPKKDHWGRYYDNRADPFNGDHSPRCVGVHPAIWHLGLVNIIGKQGRSFIVERKVGAEVDNHPMAAYEMEYFNPNNGRRYKDINKNLERIDEDDQFRMLRSKDAKYIIGVQTEMVYIDWERPNREFVDNEGKDDLVDKKMYYDLELDHNLNIVGGQWRAFKTGTGRRSSNNSRATRGGNHNQPDFFWVITKDWKDFFEDEEGLEPWIDTTKAPPASWLAVAKEKYHENVYYKTYEYGTGQKCRVFHKRTGQMRVVPCEYVDPRPTPLINVVNKLIELTK